MKFIDETQVLDFYCTLLHEDKITFFVQKPLLKAQLLGCIEGLKDHENLHNRIETAKKVWKILFEASLTSIDPDKRGYDGLFKYFDAYVQFEELIFASDSFYRDHTLHCLWVYFLGEYLTYHEDYQNVLGQENGFTKVMQGILDVFKSLDFPQNSYMLLEQYLRAIPDMGVVRCLTALTHDLGYPLKKIRKINQSIQSILPYFGIDRFTEFDFQYGAAEMPFIQEMIKTMSIDFNFNPDKPKNSNLTQTELFKKYFTLPKDGIGAVLGVHPAVHNFSAEELIQDWEDVLWETDYFLNNSTSMRYTHDFEKYQHGILSAYILFRHLNIFQNTGLVTMGTSGYGIAQNRRKVYNTVTILFNAIADHTSEGYRITTLNNPSAVLTFIDEIEEFSRISRANQNRQFIAEFCKTSLEVIDGVFHVSFVFDNDELEDLNPEMAFKSRCKRMLKLFNIPKLDNTVHIIIHCIGQLPHNKKHYSLEIKRGIAKVTIDGEMQHIPSYLRSNEYYTTEEYSALTIS